MNVHCATLFLSKKLWCIIHVYTHSTDFRIEHTDPVTKRRATVQVSAKFSSLKSKQPNAPDVQHFVYHSIRCRVQHQPTLRSWSLKWWYIIINFERKKKGGGGENRVSILHLSSISSITLVVVAIDLPHRRYCRTLISKRYRRSLIEKWI